MTTTPIRSAAVRPHVERGSGKTAHHCGLCGAHKPVPSLAYLCELRHLEEADAAA